MKINRYCFFIILPLFMISSCVLEYRVEKAISANEINLINKALCDISIDSIEREINEASFLNKYSGKYSYYVKIHASNDSIGESCLRKKIEDIVKPTISLMYEEKMCLYNLYISYSSDSRVMSLDYEIDKKLKAHLINYYYDQYGH